MKKSFKFFILVVFMFTLTGCFEKEKEDVTPNIYTTIYPTEYIIKYLYGDYANIESIYPSEVDLKNYKLTKKQIDNYSKGDYFIYNGLSNEKDIAKSLINNNNKLQLIDVSYDLTYNYGVEELWLSPNIFLMLAKNVKKNLINYIPEKYEQIKTIETKFDELSETISLLDAELRNTATTAKANNKNRILASSNMFKYLEKYGFVVDSLDGVTVDSNEYNKIKNNVANKNYHVLLIRDVDNDIEVINKIKSSYTINTLTVNTMLTLTTNNVENSEDYLSIMNKYINELDKFVNN
ncbi:MAG: zinc ABC transporter substrate-binding protein [Bacilli bacterium]|nr:zinc ABC transporter substrate-binding protein [Bacilli bacterium]